MSAVTPPVHEGDVLGGKYRIDRVLGAGGMGIVVLATHLQLDRKVALKFLHAAALENAELVGRFAREARAAARLHSEHVARVLDVGSLESGAPFMVMEYLEGTDLDEIVKGSGALPVETAVDYLMQACEAIAEAHTAGIVHRDLKPANLFVARAKDGSALVKVLDFGVSKVALADEGSMTQTTAMMGSPLYMSPEHLQSTRDVDHRTDIWALGIILFQMLTGEVPYRADTMPQLCVKILSEPPPPLRQRRPDLPPALEAVVARCLARDRNARYPDVAALAADLAPFGGATTRLLAAKIARMAPSAQAPAPHAHPSNAEAHPPIAPVTQYAPPAPYGQPGQPALPYATTAHDHGQGLPSSSQATVSPMVGAAPAPAPTKGGGKVFALLGGGLLLLIAVVAIVVSTSKSSSSSSSDEPESTTRRSASSVASSASTTSAAPAPAPSVVGAPAPSTAPSSHAPCFTCRRFLEGCGDCSSDEVCSGASRNALFVLSQCTCRQCTLECGEHVTCGGTREDVKPACLACQRGAIQSVCEAPFKVCMEN